MTKQEITRQELLTKLALECATWKGALCTMPWYDVTGEVGPTGITKQDWLAERERLLNKPDWALEDKGLCQ